MIVTQAQAHITRQSRKLLRTIATPYLTKHHSNKSIPPPLPNLPRQLPPLPNIHVILVERILTAPIPTPAAPAPPIHAPQLPRPPQIPPQPLVLHPLPQLITLLPPRLLGPLQLLLRPHLLDLPRLFHQLYLLLQHGPPVVVRAADVRDEQPVLLDPVHPPLVLGFPLGVLLEADAAEFAFGTSFVGRAFDPGAAFAAIAAAAATAAQREF